MTHQEIIQRFENDVIAEDSFHHVDHVRLGFAYLCEYPPLPALERFVTALKRFAAARGKAHLYHETITHAYFFLIRERMAGSQGADWDEFARQNPDLLVWKDGILNRYYQETTLKSELARTVFAAKVAVRIARYVGSKSRQLLCGDGNLKGARFGIGTSRRRRTHAKCGRNLSLTGFGRASG